MRNFEMNGNMPVTQQFAHERGLELPVSPVLQIIVRERMATAALFAKQTLLGSSNPFEMPQIPDEARAKFDTGGGGQQE